jgi:hypothetical protein
MTSSLVLGIMGAVPFATTALLGLLMARIMDPRREDGDPPCETTSSEPTREPGREG